MSERTLDLISKNDVRWVDLRFTDTKGKEQHVSIPATAVDEDFFEGGKMFDGSSISGWKGINESDMILMPDDSTAILDPFTDDPTVIVRCDIVEPATMQGYDRDPRSIAKKAEAYLNSSGLGDTAYFGPEPEFFVFDDVKWNVEMSGASYAINAEEAAWSSNADFEDGNTGHRPRVKGGYFPFRLSTLCTTFAQPCARQWSKWALMSRCITTKLGRRVNAKSASSSTRLSQRPMKYKSLSTAC